MRYLLIIAMCIVAAGKAGSQAAPEIAQFEYFIDEDPGYGNGTQVQVSDFTVAGSGFHHAFPVTVPSGLSNGLHRLFFRAKDENGDWSQTTFQVFYKDELLSDNGSEIVAMEYFIDNDPGTGNGTGINLAAAAFVDGFLFEVPASHLLSDGPHTLFVRSKNSAGQWSILNLVSFDKEPDAGLSLGQSGDVVNTAIPDNILFDLVSSENRILATLKGKGLSSATAQFSGSVVIDGIIRIIDNQPMLQRFFELTPGGTGPAAATITLYLTKEEMAAFNTKSTVKLPEAPTDDKSALRVWQWHGNKPAVGDPDEVIDPIDADIAWDGVLQAWRITFDVTAFSTFYVTAEGSTALPVRLANFKAQKQENAIHLSWQTTTEANSNRFDIEHARDGKSWIKIGAVASEGESDALRSYHYIHRDPPAGLHYYRLKMVDVDGTFGFSEIASVNLPTRSREVSLYPSPASEKLTISAGGPVESYEIVNALGQVVGKGTLTGGLNRQITVKHLPPGIYHVRVRMEDGGWVARKVVVE